MSQVLWGFKSTYGNNKISSRQNQRLVKGTRVEIVIQNLKCTILSQVGFPPSYSVDVRIAKFAHGVAAGHEHQEVQDVLSYEKSNFIY